MSSFVCCPKASPICSQAFWQLPGSFFFQCYGLSLIHIYLVVSIITTVLTGPLDRLLGRKRTMIFAAAVLILGKVWFVIDQMCIRDR